MNEISVKNESPLKKGKYVRFTDTNENGKYTFIGQVKSIDDKEIVINAERPYGVVTMPISDLSKLRLIKKKPRNFDAKVANKPAETAPTEVVKSTVKVVKRKSIGHAVVLQPAAKKAAKKVAKTGTKAERVFELVKANKNRSRQELIGLVIKKVGMTPAGASTYVSNARKAFK